jgi:protocatechuate 3,4-dioxygenase beta subunit
MRRFMSAHRTTGDPAANGTRALTRANVTLERHVSRKGWLVVVGIVALGVLLAVLRCPAQKRVATSPVVLSDARTTGGATTRRREGKPPPKPPAGGLRLEGQVIDEHDQPVADAVVRFYNFDRETRTGEDGSFVFESLGADEYSVTAEKGEDFYCEGVHVTLTATSEPVILRLMPGATATLRIVDAVTRGPIAGARVGLRTSDANGEVTVRGLRPGGNNIAILGVEADGYESSRAKLTGLDLGTPEDNVFVVELQPGFAIRGTVLGVDGEAIVAADVTATTARGQVDATIDAAGAWTVTLARGAHELTATAPGYLESSPLAIEVDGARSGIVLRFTTRSPPSTDVIDDTPEVTGTIAGTVVDTRGRPAPGVHVFRSGGFSEPVAITDAKGHFEITDITSESHYVWAAPADTRYGPVRGVTAAAGDHDVRLTVTEVGRLTGRVTLDGKPVVYYGVYLPEADQVMESPLIVRAPDGRFSLPGVAGGTYAVVIAGPGFARKTIANVKVPEDGDVDLGTIAVDRGRTVRGRVTDATGAGVAGATVTVHDRDTPRDALTRALNGSGLATTDANGNFRITALAPPFYESSQSRRIVATHPVLGVSTERVLAPDATEIDLVLAKPGAIDGHLQGATTGVFAQRVDDPSFVYAESPDRTGAFHFVDLAPGMYRVRPNEVTAARAIVKVVSGQRAKVSLVVPAEKVELRVVARDCKDRVTLTTDDGLDVLADYPCGVAFSYVPPGSYRVCVEARCAPVKVTATPAVQTTTL